MAKVIMIQGTMSGAGKSLLVAGLCRVMKRDGYRVAPFKSQNMALNSFITREGLEMGRAQAMQAEAAGIAPLACMNPVLLKPTDHTGSQVIVNGQVLGNMGAREYFAYKKNLLPDIKRAFQKLEGLADIIVVEGAGSPAEINLREHDIVNMGLAEVLDAPVLLAGDIDRGGVFAQLLGTLMLLTEAERSRVKGLIINKFRGDKSLLDEEIAKALYIGIVHDTGVFRYSNTSPKTLRAAAELISYGFDFSRLIDETFYEKTYVQNQILGRALLESIIFMDGKCVVSMVDKKTMGFYRADSHDLDGIVNQLRLTKGVECAIFMYQTDVLKYKVSLRSNGKVDVAKVAMFFGGGGHVRAAGADMQGTFHDIVNNLSAQIDAQLKTEKKA